MLGAEPLCWQIRLLTYCCWCFRATAAETQGEIKRPKPGSAAGKCQSSNGDGSWRGVPQGSHTCHLLALLWKPCSGQGPFHTTNSLGIQFPPEAIANNPKSNIYVLLLPFQLVIGSFHVSNPLAEGKLGGHPLSLQLVVCLEGEQALVGASARTSSAAPTCSRGTRLPVRWQAPLPLGARWRLSAPPQPAPCCTGCTAPTRRAQSFCEQISGYENQLSVCGTVQKEPPLQAEVALCRRTDSGVWEVTSCLISSPQQLQIAASWPNVCPNLGQPGSLPTVHSFAIAEPQPTPEASSCSELPPRRHPPSQDRAGTNANLGTQGRARSYPRGIRVGLALKEMLGEFTLRDKHTRSISSASILCRWSQLSCWRASCKRLQRAGLVSQRARGRQLPISTRLIKTGDELCPVAKQHPCLAAPCPMLASRGELSWPLFCSRATMHQG